MLNKVAIVTMIKSLLIAVTCFISFSGNTQSLADFVTIEVKQFQVPVLIGKRDNPLMRIKMIIKGTKSYYLDALSLSARGTTDIADITAIDVYACGSDSTWPKELELEKIRFGKTIYPKAEIVINGQTELRPGVHYFWISCRLSDQADLLHKVGCQLIQAKFAYQTLNLVAPAKSIRQRIGVDLKRHLGSGIHTYRIPGLAVTNKGTLLAVFDARRQSSRDLQGDIDIGLHRSTDGGQTWQPLQIPLDMGQWGNLPEKYNGVSDPCILVDKNSNAIYIAALWMHGIINEQGHWVEGLNENSKDWNHQWKNKGSQPGYDVKQSSQLMIVKSIDDGKTWSEPVNLTKMCKKPAWWLLAPAPGNGITLFDGTLVFPCQGRDAKGKAFSTIMYSKDDGVTWQTGKKALNSGHTTECTVVQLSDGSLMLNMRAGKNKGNLGSDNGRAICITHDLGENWLPHQTSFNALPEPVCMGSLYKHTFTEESETRSILLFSNPNSKRNRDHLSLKVSFDHGMNWPRSYWILLDELKSRGYSCISSVGEKYIGILYESSQADMVFQKIALSELLNKKNTSSY